MLGLVVTYVEVFTLVLVRISSFFFLTPFFGARNIPMVIKIALAFMIALLMTPVLAASEAGQLYAGAGFADMFLIIVKELMVGITLAMIAAFIFAAIQVGGMFIDMQIGFVMANVFDPLTGASAPLTGQFKYALAMLLFLGLDGHHGLLAALLQSYNFLPLGSFVMSDNLLSIVVETFTVMFLLGLKIAAPIIASLFLTDVGLAILSRAVPQMNVFVIGMPTKVLVGSVMIFVAMPAFIYLLRGLFHTMYGQLDMLLRAVGGI
ncbi:flagellar biosynthetic protein FliR [Tumebacillus algifaecis]|uniref:Flagellar biosynthetic protein FliR n=1 Tax=Tumebacillus algifaecis TaxID=1214604 RepID=A0A223D2N4_9BACL|nr:flagellar biosynthetic protein FliR [Tumebacillus algifaecis]ASS75636.1 flagellar biosynthetic protein FliR [Tumebacillus algifaecis]